MTTLLLAFRADGRPWVAHRNARLNAARLFARLHPSAHIHRRVAAQCATADEMIGWLGSRREGATTVSRYEEEGYLLAFEARLKELGKPKIAHRKQAEIRRNRRTDDAHVGLGLATVTALFTIWEQCAARWYDHEPNEIPRSVKLILIGCQNLNAVEEDLAVLLTEDAYLRRRKNLPAERFPNLRDDVVREWVAASGGTAGHLERAQRMLGRGKDDRLAELTAAGGYARLAPEMADVALQLAEGDARLAFFVFRVMQRVAACTVDGEAMWVAEWLRGAKAHEHAIPGATGKPKLVEIVQDRILGEVTKGHSGAAAIPTTYRVKLAVQLGTCGPAEAASRLGLPLNAKGLPRR